MMREVNRSGCLSMNEPEEGRVLEQTQRTTTAKETQATYRSQSADTEDPKALARNILLAHPEALKIALIYSPENDSEKLLSNATSTNKFFQAMDLFADETAEPSPEETDELNQLSSDIQAIDARIRERQATTKQLAEETRQILSELAETVAAL